MSDETTSGPEPHTRPHPGTGTGGDTSTDEAAVDLARALLARARDTAGAAGTASSGGPRGAAPRGTRTTRPNHWRSAAPPASLSGPGPDERDPQGLGGAVERLVSERGWQVPVAVGGVEGRWDQIVGSDLAAHCWPEGFEAGVVVVRTDSTAWATQLRLLTGPVMRRLNDELGAGTVTSLRVLGPAGPSWRRGRFRVPGRGPRDTYG